MVVYKDTQRKEDLTVYDELAPSNGVYYSAGQKAYMLGGILPQDNPYRLNPAHDLWNQGYQDNKSRFEPPPVVRVIRPWKPRRW